MSVVSKVHRTPFGIETIMFTRVPPVKIEFPLPAAGEAARLENLYRRILAAIEREKS